MSPRHTARGQGPFAVTNFDKYKRKLKNRPKKQMYWAVAAEYSYRAAEKMDYDEMVEAYMAMEIRNEQIDKEIEQAKEKGG